MHRRSLIFIFVLHLAVSLPISTQAASFCGEQAGTHSNASRIPWRESARLAESASMRPTSPR